jgi:imidazolonepropionase-like amidohydrolase
MFCTKQRFSTALAMLAAGWFGIGDALAQDVAITNARIVVGDGTVIDSGTIVVRDGRIAEVGAGRIAARGLTSIDARGMTAMPGFIDAHRHINTGPDEKAEMQAQLEAGYTTILSGGGPVDSDDPVLRSSAAAARRQLEGDPRALLEPGMPAPADLDLGVGAG